MNPPLTTVRISHYHMGTRAAETVLGLARARERRGHAADRAHRGVLQDVAGLPRSELRVDRDQDRAQPRQREQQHDVIRAVGRHRADALTGPDAAGGERPRYGVHASGEFRVAEVPARVAQQRTGGVDLRTAGKEPAQAVVVRGITLQDGEW